MEIIHLILGKANPARMNGVNRVVYELASEQEKLGRKVQVWGISKSVEHNYAERNFKTRLFKAAPNPFSIPKELKTALLQLGGETTIHLHGGWIPVYASLGSFLNKNRIPFVLTAHGAYNKLAMRKSALLKQIYYDLFERKLLERAGQVHCLGESELKSVKNLNPHLKTTLLPYGFQHTEKVETRNPKAQKFVLGYVGRIDIHTKGLDILLEGFAELVPEYSNMYLILVGDGKELAQLKNLCRSLGIENHVEFTGALYDLDKIAALERMDVFAHPSRNEGLPAAVLEAASLGLPCLVSEATNMATYVETYQAGVSFQNQSVEAFKDSLLLAYRSMYSGQLQNWSANAISMVKDIFNWPDLLTSYDKMYSACRS